MSETYLRSAFKNWITAAEKSGLEPIASPRIDAYVNALKFSTTKIIGAKLPTTDLFLYVTIEEFQSARKIIEHSQNFAFVNETSDGVFGEALDLYSRFLEDITKPVCWIFSSNPKVYDIIPAVQELSIITWRVEQRDKMIKKNDRVYLWLPGVDGGIVASGTIISSPEERDPLRGDPYVVDENLFFEAFLGVDIKIDRRFTNPIISANMLLKNEITKTLEILVFPGSYHYYVMPEQEAAIECVIENCPEPEHFDSVDMTSDEMTDTEAPIDLNTDSAEMTPSDSVTSSSQVFASEDFGYLLRMTAQRCGPIIILKVSFLLDMTQSAIIRNTDPANRSESKCVRFTDPAEATNTWAIWPGNFLKKCSPEISSICHRMVRKLSGEA